MVSLIARWWITPGQEEIVMPALERLAAQVRAEPGTLLYLVHTPNFTPPDPRSTSEPVPRPGEVTFVEVYDSWQAFQDHLAGPAFTGFKRTYGPLFIQARGAAGAQSTEPFIQVEFLDRVARFLRPEGHGRE
jgi:quinol monooxygenase YgiN